LESSGWSSRLAQIIRLHGGDQALLTVGAARSAKEVKRTVPAMSAEGDFPPDLAGRRAVVTGAARGIGEAIAKELISSGARVVAIDRDEDVLDSAYEGLACETIQGDLAGEDLTLLAKKVLQDGPVELLVNNVGITTKQDFWGIELGDLRSVYRTNVEGPWFFTKWLMEALLEEQQARSRLNEQAPRGAVVFICSLHANVVLGEPHYGTSKAAVAQLTRELAWKLGPSGIRVNSISPGWIRTAENRDSKVQQEKFRRLQPRIPLQEPGYPVDVAKVALSLLSDARSGYVTGVNVPVDGGLSLTSWATDQTG
jgi:NAD(P)-dependent dehydrogenase (short-subunit alcohol dehydrogenase family)